MDFKFVYGLMIMWSNIAFQKAEGSTVRRASVYDKYFSLDNDTFPVCVFKLTTSWKGLRISHKGEILQIRHLTAGVYNVDANMWAVYPNSFGIVQV